MRALVPSPDNRPSGISSGPFAVFMILAGWVGLRYLDHESPPATRSDAASPRPLINRLLTMHRKKLPICSEVENVCAEDDTAMDVRPVEGPAADKELALLTKAVGHPARVQILRLLSRRRSCICGEIADAFPLAQSTVSQHLKILKAAGLIRGDVDGTRVCYCVDARTLRRLKALIAVI